MRATLTVNGRPIEIGVEPDDRLLDVLRDRLGLLGTKEACGRGECGACTVLVRGRPVMSCLVLAARVDSVETIEGLRDEARALREAFADAGAFQCGFCTPGQIVRGVALLREGLPAGRTGPPPGDLGQHLPLHRVLGDRPRAAAGRAHKTGRAPMTVGRPTRSIEWDARTSGASRYVADVVVPGTLVARVLRSPHPHARIVSIDVQRRLADARRRGGAHRRGPPRSSLQARRGAAVGPPTARPGRRAVRRGGGRRRRRGDGRSGGRCPRRHPGPLPAASGRHHGRGGAGRGSDPASRARVGLQRLPRDRPGLRRRRGRAPGGRGHCDRPVPVRSAGARLHGAERLPGALGSGDEPARALDLHPVSVLRAGGGRADPGARARPGDRARGRGGRRLRVQVQDHGPRGTGRRPGRPHGPAGPARPRAARRSSPPPSAGTTSTWS